MKSRCRLWWLLLAVSPTLAHAQLFTRTIANSTETSTVCVTWNHRDYTYHVDVNGSARTPGETEFTAIDAAFAAWQSLSDSCSDFTFKRGERVSKPVVGKGTPDSNVITFREVACASVVPETDPCLNDEAGCGNKYTCWDHDQGTIALTTVTYSTRTGIATDADIELNAAEFLLTSLSSPPCEEGHDAVTCVAYDIQNTMTHEIGHVVGFAHVTSNPSSLMYPTAPLGETAKRSIDQGTATGFCTTYPKGEPPVPCDDQLILQRHVIASAGCGCANFASPVPWLALMLLAMTMRRQRAR